MVNLDRISELFPEGGAVGVEDLVAKGAVRDGRPVKVLGAGEITVAVQVKRARVLRLRQGEDRRRRRHRHRALSPAPTTMTRPGPGRSDCDSGGRRPTGPLLGFRGLAADGHRLDPHSQEEDQVLGAFANAFRTPDLRRKLLFVLLIIVVFRLGSQIPTPGVNVPTSQACFEATENQRPLRPDQPVLAAARCCS